MTTEIQSLIEKFTVRLQEAALSEATDAIVRSLNKPSTDWTRSSVHHVNGNPFDNSPANLKLVPVATNRKTVKRARRKGPIQLCPVPRCTGRAAPIFGMVCASHRDVPKAKIKAYRAARRARKARGA